MSWTGFKKGVSRASVSLMQKAGAVDKTNDKQFEEEEKTYRALEVKMSKLQKECKLYLDSMRGFVAYLMEALTNSQHRIAEDLEGFYSEQETFAFAVAKYKEISAVIDGTIRSANDDVFRGTLLDPLNLFIHHFSEVNEVIKKRNNKLLDYDAARTKVRKLVDKPSEDPTKLPKAEAASNEAKAIYDGVNGPLIRDLPKIVDARIPYLEPSFDAYVQSQAFFFAESLKNMEQIKSFISQAGQGLYPTNRLDSVDISNVLNEMRNLSIVSNAISP